MRCSGISSCTLAQGELILKILIIILFTLIIGTCHCVIPDSCAMMASPILFKDIKSGAEVTCSANNINKFVNLINDCSNLMLQSPQKKINSRIVLLNELRTKGCTTHRYDSDLCKMKLLKVDVYDDLVSQVISNWVVPTVSAQEIYDEMANKKDMGEIFIKDVINKKKITAERMVHFFAQNTASAVRTLMLAHAFKVIKVGLVIPSDTNELSVDQLTQISHDCFQSAKQIIETKNIPLRRIKKPDTLEGLNISQKDMIEKYCNAISFPCDD